ncbi:MAG: sigma factor-like helix-turn-helix DNA-binding protein [Gammaproteobacteria bacterium]|jgi:DNA-directed RNA polymerase sigma subunit (sigma70/sigma32)
MRDTLLDRWLLSLPLVHRKVICRRFGLGGAECGSLEDVSRELGVSVEEARRLQYLALTRLRSVTPAHRADPASHRR